MANEKMLSTLNFSSNAHFFLVSFLALCFSGSLYAKENHPSNNAETAGEDARCEDFLDSLNKKPKYLEFMGCQKITKGEVPALESKYRLKGSVAKAAEVYFIKIAGMPKLRRFCCLWESIPQNHKNKNPYGIYKFKKSEYLISMSSEETLINKRSHWNRIPYFYVSVILYLDLP